MMPGFFSLTVLLAIESANRNDPDLALLAARIAVENNQ